MRANVCPSCGGELMSFQEFLRSADPAKTFTCRACSSVLRRDKTVWLLLVLAGLLFAALPLWLVFAQWAPFEILLVSILAFPVWFLAVKFVGWTLVPWRLQTAG